MTLNAGDRILKLVPLINVENWHQVSKPDCTSAIVSLFMSGG